MREAALSSSGFLDRDGERDVLERLVAGVRTGQSRVLVLRGEAGVGKTALLRHLSEAADGCRIARAAGVESEMELPFADRHAAAIVKSAERRTPPGHGCGAECA
jgi:MoxR-like ATPase